MGASGSKLPRMTPSRRDVMKHSLSSGFALAALPVAGNALATNKDGLQAGEVKIPTAAGEIPAYRALPIGDGKHKLPVLLVVHEIFGVHEHIKDLCRRFAKLGYLAVAPELFARQGDASKYSDIKQLQQEIVSKASDAQVAADLDATIAWASAEPRADVAKLGITGFCWGGRIVWLYAEHSKQLKAGVAWYGRLVGDPTEKQPKHPVNIAADLKAPVLGLYGGKDQGIPLDSVDVMKQDLQKAASAGNAAAGASSFHIYPDAGHAFHADYRPSYRKDAAQDGWKRMLAWFKQHGVG